MNRRSFIRHSSAATLAAFGAAAALSSGCKRRSSGMPNVLWLMTDEQRTDSLGFYGSPWAVTPTLDMLAEQGAVFRNALTPAPLCTPARCSLLTGQYPAETGVWTNHADKSAPLDHLMARFLEAGYRTASFGKQHYDTKNRAFGNEKQIVLTDAVGYFAYAPEYPMEDYDVVQYPGPPFRWIFGGRYPEEWRNMGEAQVVAKAKQWLSFHALSCSPFFLRLSFNAPHTPVVVPEPFDTAVPEDAVTYPEETESPPEQRPEWLRALAEYSRSDRMTLEQIRKARRYYCNLVAFIDHLIGSLWDWMRERGMLDNTIVAYVSDHGTHIGDFGMFQKQTFFEPVLRVPYFFWYPPAISGGNVFDAPVSTCSLLPTLLDLCGIRTGRNPPDRSLAQSLRTGEEPLAAPVFSGHTLTSFGIAPQQRLVMVREGSWKLSLRMDPQPGDGMLVNLDDDPHERRNLYDWPEYASSQEHLAALIREHLASGIEPDPAAW